VRIRNWHALNWETEEKLAKKKTVDKRGAKSDEAYVREVLGEMASAQNIVVINDEAHHAWRIPAESKIKGVSKEDIEEATKWIGGLDRIHKTRGILNCYDFSATPFAPSGKKSSEEALFDWIISDFGLNDAIESGLVKTPRVVIRDDGKLTKDYKSRLYHIYNDPDVRDDLSRKAEEHETLPDLVINGYYLLGKDWLETAKKLSKKEQAEILRRTVDTVGQAGKEGEHIQKVISVGMLSEGWDAKTVTHIMGLRAFSSQLLCEQVVGRGLRRTSYEVNPKTGLFDAEYVNIFGVPFTFLPHESTDGPPPPPPPPKTKIEPVKEKMQYEIRWPNIIRINHSYKPTLKLDMEKVKPIELNAYDTAKLVEMAPIIDGNPILQKYLKSTLKT